MMSQEKIEEMKHRIEVIIKSGNSENLEYDKGFVAALDAVLGTYGEIN